MSEGNNIKSLAESCIENSKSISKLSEAIVSLVKRIEKLENKDESED